MAYFIWFFVVVFVVSKGGMSWVVLAGGLALVFVAGRTRIIPRLRRHLKKLSRQRQAEKTGLDGELKIKASLEQRGLPVLHDVYLPHPDTKGALTQIDLIALSWRGLHVLEVKAHAATIHVDPLAAEWPVAYPSGFETMLYNPIMQNSTHLAAVTALVGQEVPTTGAVIFPGATLQFLEPAEGVHADIPEGLEAGAPADAVVAAWERLSEHDRGCDKDQCRQAHLAALNAPRVHEDSTEMRNAKKLARAAWITGCQAELSTEAKLREVRRVAREAMPTASDAEVAGMVRYAQAHVTQREISSQRAAYGSLVEARRHAAGTNWLPEPEFQRAREQERRYMNGRRFSGRRWVQGNAKMTTGEIVHIVAVCVGLLGRF